MKIKMIPYGVGEVSSWFGGWERYCHQSCCMEEHRCCTDQCYRILDPWHSYTLTHTHQIPSAGENHMYSSVAGKSGPRS